MTKLSPGSCECMNYNEIILANKRLSATPTLCLRGQFIGHLNDLWFASRLRFGAIMALSLRHVSEGITVLVECGLVIWIVLNGVECLDHLINMKHQSDIYSGISDISNSIFDTSKYSEISENNYEYQKLFRDITNWNSDIKNCIYWYN